MKLMTVPEVASVLRISQTRAYALIRDELLPATHLGRQLRVSEAALRAWIAAGGTALPGGWRREAKP